MKWQILILTQESRRRLLQRLLATLVPQAIQDDVGIVISQCDRGMRLGENRQLMIDRASADYISFVDDDDMVATDYVEKIRPLLDGVDIIGFNVKCFKDNALIQVARHSLRYSGWYNDEKGLYRDISYMQPIRRQVALRSRIEGNFGEDFRWAQRLREIGCVKTEHYLDEVMYYYYYVSNKLDGVAF
jgi:glycosyltransferase involved in cell wall biosynthesis